MGVESAVRVMAGSMVLLSLVLTLLYGQGWMLLTAFVGINLIQSAFTGFCPAEYILKSLGFKTKCCAGGASECRDSEK